MPGRKFPLNPALLDNWYAAGIPTVPEYPVWGGARRVSGLAEFAWMLGGIEELLDFLLGLRIMGCGGKIECMARGFDGF
jgi:hypothetical protein